MRKLMYFETDLNKIRKSYRKLRKETFKLRENIIRNPNPKTP